MEKDFLQEKHENHLKYPKNRKQILNLSEYYAPRK